MAVDKIDYQALDQLLDELDVKSQSRHSGDHADDPWVCQRRNPRHPFRAKCKIHFFPIGSMHLAAQMGRTRNLSRNGIGMLTRRMFQIAEPIEVEITVPNRPTAYMAGTVTFCRYAGQGYHEVGLALKTASGAPIFSLDPQTAIDSIEWLREALTCS